MCTLLNLTEYKVTDVPNDPQPHIFIHILYFTIPLHWYYIANQMNMIFPTKLFFRKSSNGEKKIHTVIDASFSISVMKNEESEVYTVPGL